MFIFDNASWHNAARLNWYHFESKFLPGYAPDFNPIERRWRRFKADWFWDFMARTADNLTEQLCQGRKSFINHFSVNELVNLLEKSNSKCAKMTF